MNTGTNSPSIVYFAGVRCRGADDNKMSKVARLFEAAGFGKLFTKDMLTAVKLHFGERGNDTHLNPSLVRVVVDKLHAIGAVPFITDTNTLYKGSRHNAVSHLLTALEHGFSFATVNAPIIIADGLKGGSFTEVTINKKHFSHVKIADGIADAGGMMVLSHFKGHEMAGIGGAIKNLAMGCAPGRGKRDQHAARFNVRPQVCIACGQCIDSCPQDAISWAMENGKKCASIDKQTCVGCGECLTVCQPKAVTLDFKTETKPFNERMVEYAYGAVLKKKGRVGYINFVMNITPDCDCVPWSDAPLVPDVGILASLDPVALDQACYDLVNKQEGFRHSHLKSNHAAGCDKFKGVWDYTVGDVQMSYAESIGLGTTKYELKEV